MEPFTAASAVIFVGCGVGLWYYFTAEKARLNRKRVRDASKGTGKPRIGGEYALVDQDGKQFTSDDMRGKFALIYFGFTHCPDICPDELDKMARIIDLVKSKRGLVLRPLFITCDPNRDSPPVVKTYLSEFHKDIIGLTGTWEQVKDVCKKYRVYFSTPPHVKPGQDYLVDHSIYFYLMDPDGEFIEVIGREHSANRGAKVITDHIGDWEGSIDRS
ncbi:MAG: Cu-binding protein [Chrysothrix sp. TS-e1954]|nr:MAG: Cu-binding protein [Chrysothrix sp. TS-e1954]